MAEAKHPVHSSIPVRATPQIQAVLETFKRIKQRTTAIDAPLDGSVLIQPQAQGWGQYFGITHNSLSVQSLNMASLEDIDRSIRAELADNPNPKVQAQLKQLRQIKVLCMHYIDQNQNRNWFTAANLDDLSHSKVLAMLLIIHTCHQAMMRAGDRAQYCERLGLLLREYLKMPELTCTSSNDSQYLSFQTTVTQLIEIYDNPDIEQTTRFEAFKSQVKTMPLTIEHALKETRDQLTLLCSDKKLTVLDLEKEIPAFLKDAHALIQKGDFSQIQSLFRSNFSIEDLPSSSFTQRLNDQEKQAFCDVLNAYQAILGYRYLFEHISPVLDSCGLGYYSAHAYYIEKMTEDLNRAQASLSRGMRVLERSASHMLSNKKEFKINPKSAMVSNLNHLIAKDPHDPVNGRHARLHDLEQGVSTLKTVLPGPYQGEAVKVKEEFLTFHHAFLGLYANDTKAERHRDQIVQGLEHAHGQEAADFVDHVLEDMKLKLAEFDKILKDLHQNHANPQSIQTVQSRRDALADCIKNYTQPIKTDDADDDLMGSFVLITDVQKNLNHAQQLLSSTVREHELKQHIEYLNTQIQLEQTKEIKFKTNISDLETEKSTVSNTIHDCKTQISEKTQELKKYPQRTGFMLWLMSTFSNEELKKSNLKHQLTLCKIELNGATEFLRDTINPYLKGAKKALKAHQQTMSPLKEALKASQIELAKITLPSESVQSEELDHSPSPSSKR